jgi:WD40 repeat protein
MALREWSAPLGDPDVTPLDFRGVNDWMILPSGERLVTGRGDAVYLSPLPDASRELRFVGKHDADVFWIFAHPTAPRAVSGDESGEIRIWSFSGMSGRLERTFRSPAPRSRAYLAPNDSWLIAAPGGAHSTSDVAYLWDLKGPPDAEPIALQNGNAKWSWGAAIDPEGHWLLTANADFGILWPLGAKRARVLRGQSPPFIVVAFTPDGRGLISSSDDGTVRLWPLALREGERSRVLMEGGGLLGVSMGVDPLGRYVLAGDRFGPRVSLLPLEGGEPRRMPGFTEGAVSSLGFSLDGRLAVAAGLSPSVLRVWDLETGEVRTVDTRVPGEKGCGPERFEGSVEALAFLDDERLLTVGEQGIRVWDIERGTSRRIGPCRPNSDPRLAASPDRRRALIRYGEMRATTFGLLDVETGVFHEIASHGRSVFTAAFDPSGKVIVSGDTDGVVRVGPLDGGEPHLLYGHTLEVSSVAVSPDGKWIASGSQDGTIRLWPMPEGSPFHTLPYDAILERLRGLTNLRVVPDEGSGTGYRVEVGPFPGWKRVPAW